jgi:hypothetical protein
MTLTQITNRPWVATLGGLQMKQWIVTTGAVALTAIVSASNAYATTITFDALITPGANATVNIYTLTAEYEAPAQNVPNPFLPESFRTQGFLFGGFTVPVTPARTSPDAVILLDASQCFNEAGAVCASNNSKYLVVAGDPLSMNTDTFGNFSVSSFDASSIFDANGCPGCDSNGVVFGASFVRVTGIRLVNGVNVIVADEIFPLLQPFQTVVLTDPDWQNVFKAVFSPVDANGNLVGRVLGVDNINAAAPVPEPASLTLLGAGLAGIIARRRARKV